MFIAANEPPAMPGAAYFASSAPFDAHSHRASSLYRQLSSGAWTPAIRVEAAQYLREQLHDTREMACDLPEFPAALETWMRDNAHRATGDYGRYLEERKAGTPRLYFDNRAHALYFLRAVSPTKLADGAWLYGLLAHHRNPRLADLVRTYLEELGEGAADKNHVVLYRQLLSRYGLEGMEGLPESFYVQGVIQLALACNAEDFLPEIIGFNLGYEQLPLHLLITAYELNELGLDPYYFTLHVTVDNPDTGHSRRAVQAVMDNLPRFGDANEFWERVRAGYQLSHAGTGSCAVIQSFDADQEVVRIFSKKSSAGHGAHSDYCRVGGRNVNDWLADPKDIPAFLQAMRRAGWIRQGQPVDQSRFWQLLRGTRAEMFGVFSSYELQVIHDWIRGAGASVDGLAYTDEAKGPEPRRTSFRVAARLAAARAPSTENGLARPDLLDSDLQALAGQLPLLSGGEQAALLIEAMAPYQHWTPAGLLATQLFCQRTF